MNFRRFFDKISQKFHLNSILARIIISAMIGMLLLAIFSISIFYNYEYTRTADSNFSLIQSSVESIASAADQILLDSLSRDILALTNNYTLLEVIYYVEPTFTQTYKVSTELNLTRSGNRYISSIIYCDSRHDIVLDSEYHIGSSSDSYQNLLKYYNENKPYNNVIYNSSLFDFFCYEGEYYLAANFAGRSKVSYGQLLFKINVAQMYSTLFSEYMRHFDCYFFTEYHQPIFPDNINYDNLQLSEHDLDSLSQSSDHYLKQGKHIFFYHQSSVTNWEFIIQTNTISIQPPVKSIFSLFFPILLLLIVIAVVLSLIISHIIYKPLQEMYKSVLNILPDDIPRSKVELDYVPYAFSEVSANLKQLEGIMADISDDVLRRIFSDLLNNVSPNYEYVKTSVQTINSPFQFNNIYVVSVIEFPENHEMGSRQNENSSISRVINALTPFNASSNSFSYVQRAKSNYLAIITSFAPTADIDEAHRVLDNMETMLKCLLNQDGLTIHYARGHFYHSILDVTASYNRAISVLSSMSWNADAEPTVYGLPSVQKGTKDREDALGYQIAQLLSGIGVQKDTELNASLQNIFDNLRTESSSSLSELISLSGFLKQFWGALESMSLINESDIVVSTTLIDECSKCDEISALPQCTRIREHCTDLLIKAQDLHRAITNPYLIKAKEYIMEHYALPNLSLDLIASECNITPNYLSKLFAASGMYYSEYISHYRIIRSVSLLQETNMTVNEIATQCGFNSTQSYIRVFKKQMGSTPGQLRK